MPTARAVYELLRSQLGVSEDPPGSNRQRYGQALRMNGVAWCALLVSWAFWTLSGLPLIGGLVQSYTPTFAKWFHSHGLWHEPNERMRLGDIPFFAFYGPNYQGRWRGICHVGFTEADDRTDGRFVSIEGNTSAGDDTNGGQVQRRVRSRVYLAGFGRPNYATPARFQPVRRKVLHAVDIFDKPSGGERLGGMVPGNFFLQTKPTSKGVGYGTFGKLRGYVRVAAFK
jgi:hypothetical protein